MWANVLRSKRAVAVNIEIMCAVVRLQQILATHKDLTRRIAALEKKYDAQLRVVFDALRALMDPPPQNQRRMGFRAGDDREKTTRSTKGCRVRA